MGIQVPLLVIDRRRVSVMSTLFSNRRGRTLKVSMTVIMSLCILMYRRSWSAGCDHGRDEESRNGRDVKIYILEAYVWTSEWFRVKTGIYRSTGRLPEPPGSLMGLMGLSGKGGRAGQGGRAPLPPFPSPSRTRRRGGAPLSLSLHLRKPSWTRIGGGNPTHGGS